MLSRFTQNDYDCITSSHRKSTSDDRHAIAKDWPANTERGRVIDSSGSRANNVPSAVIPKASVDHKPGNTLLRHGHTLTYIALFLFTVVLYARPAEIYPSAITNSIALIIGIATLALFVPTQLALEGTPTARPSEVNFVLLFFLTGLLSIPLALNRLEAWQEFNGTFLRCVVIFIVIVNAVRSEARLKALLLLALVVSIWLSFGAINDYRLGLMTVEGYRVGGRGGGIFGNSNDMALHLVTIVPIAVALLLGSRSLVRKSLYAGCAVLMVAAIALTYSRGAFIGLLVSGLFMAWRIAPRRRLEIFIGGLVLVVAFLAIAPGGYALRLASIFVPSLDPLGSSDARRGELIRSLYVAIRHPLLGIGMGNYQPEMSHRGLVTHNSYTQVAAEMGAAALVCYLLFIVTPLRKLGQVARETFEVRSHSHFYYLAVGLQASLLGYMVSSFFASVAYLWYVFYLVGYAVCLRRLYESETGKIVVVEKRRDRKRKTLLAASIIDSQERTVTT
jgi:O-antigen ligase